MKYKWLNKINTDKLIIFFNGWGMDDYIVSGLEFDGFNVLMFYDYRDLSLSIDNELIYSYKNRYIVAWSMGVMIATLFEFGHISATALCGSLYPISDEYGIPERIYELTINGFSINSASKFLDRMFLKPVQMSAYSNRDYVDQKEELIALKQYLPNKKFTYDKVIVPSNDIIIPTKNQLNYWNGFNNLQIIKSGHCPFHIYKKWSELI